MDATEKPASIKEFKGGVLIIGSLFWDRENQIRRDWLLQCLDETKKITDVQAPIRYGRISPSRNCTFTMVFSTECDTDTKTGRAIFVPFHNNIQNEKDLHKQVIRLIKAERNEDDLETTKYNWAWGAVGLLANPKASHESKALFSNWEKQFTTGFTFNDYKVGNEVSAINKQGMLNMKWPEQLNKFDFLIATATKPEKEYPTIKNIAQRMVVNGYREYFNNNRANNIITFQDEEIARMIETLKSDSSG